MSRRGESCSKMYVTEPPYNDFRYNDIISTQSQFKQNIEFNSIT